ncbi:MAG: hypothetical protein ACHQD8_07715, partial [Chitinophagales bacterium]
FNFFKVSVFDVDYNVLVKQLLPVRLRQSKIFAWLKCLLAPVKWLYNLFKIYRDNNLYMLAHNSEVCYLEAALNDTFDSINRGIYLSDGVYVDPVYIYLVPELKPVFIDLASEIGTSVIPAPDPVPLYLDEEIYAGIGAYTFIVNVPVAVTFDMARLRALVDLYRLPGKKYNVVAY